MENNSPVTKQVAPEDNSDALKVVKEVEKEQLEYRRPFEKPWREYDDAYYGKQHKTGEDKKTVKNHIFKIIEGEVPILTDSMPGTQVTATLQDKQVDADNLNKAIRYVYQDQNLPLIIPSLVRQSLISAPGWLYVYHNPDADGGKGKEEYIQLPWDAVSVDGNAQTIEQANSAQIKIPKRRGALARMWPEHYKEIMDLAGSSLKDSKGDSDNFEQRDVSTEDDGGQGKPAKATSKDILNYKETWVKDYGLEPIPAEDLEEELVKEREQLLRGEAPDVGKWENHDAHIGDHGQSRAQVLAQIGLPGDAPIELVSQTVEQLLQQNPQAEALANIVLIVQIIDNHQEEHQALKKLNPKGERPKFKDGWRLIKTAGNIVLYDGPNPEEREGVGHIPLVPFYCYKDDTIYGFGEVKNILDPQRTLNTVDWHEYENLKVNSNTGWVADHESGVDETQLTNAPGLVIKKKKGTEVRRQEPGQVSPQLERRKLLDAEFIEDASGVNRESQGNMASSASGIAITKLQTQAIGRIRLKDRYLQHYSIRRLAILTAQLILNHWSEEKQFRLRTEDGSIEDIVFDPLKMADLNYTVEISAGSMAGIDKDALNAYFMQLLSDGHITFEEFLLVADFPKKEILLTKLRERMAKDQSVQEVQAQLQELQMQNAQLKGLIGSGDLAGLDEKKVYDQAAKQALLEKLLMAQQQAPAPQEMNGNPGVDQGQPVNQGNM